MDILFIINDQMIYISFSPCLIFLALFFEPLSYSSWPACYLLRLHLEIYNFKHLGGHFARFAPSCDLYTPFYQSTIYDKSTRIYLEAADSYCLA